MAAIALRAWASLLDADSPMQQWAALTNRVRAHAVEQRYPLRWMALIALPPVVQRLAGLSGTPAAHKAFDASPSEEGWHHLGRFTALSLAAFVMITKMNRPCDRNPRGVRAVVRVLGWQVANAALLLTSRER